MREWLRRRARCEAVPGERKKRGKRGKRGSAVGVPLCPSAAVPLTVLDGVAGAKLALLRANQVELSQTFSNESRLHNYFE